MLLLPALAEALASEYAPLLALLQPMLLADASAEAEADADLPNMRGPFAPATPQRRRDVAIIAGIFIFDETSSRIDTRRYRTQDYILVASSCHNTNRARVSKLLLPMLENIISGCRVPYLRYRRFT
jgi:hypothetical protein